MEMIIMYNTDFYKLLKSSKYSSRSLVKIINIMKPLIHKYSIIEDEITGKSYYDEDLESTIIEYVIKVIKTKPIANRIAKEGNSKKTNNN